MRHTTWVLGYHGCDQEVGEAILSGRAEIKTSYNKYDWLGEGAYFWEDSYSRALAWAKFLKGRPEISRSKIKSPFVIGAVIDPGNCLDLADDASLRIVEEAYKNMEWSLGLSGAPVPKNKEGFEGDEDLVKRELDCAVINFLHRYRKASKEPEFNTVRAPFLEGKYLFPGSRFHDKTHVQWCVRYPKKSILGYFRYRESAA